MNAMPTHTCFDDSIEFLEKLIKEDFSLVDSNEVVLVHAIVQPEGAPEPFSHAWLERTKDDLAFHIVILNGEKSVMPINKIQNKKLWNPLDVTKYTPREAWAENARTGYYGPWKPEYLELRSNKKRERAKA